MSFAALSTLHASPALAAVAFAVALTSWLVAAEEAEVRRARAPGRGEG